MKVLAAIAVVLMVLGAIEALDSSQELFQEFIEKYDRHYKSLAEHSMRYLAFMKNLEKSKQLQEFEQGTAVYGINKFSDFTEDELHTLNGLKVPRIPHNVPKPSPWPASVPDSFDWRDHNAVTPVKNQGGCRTCWAFSAVANIEGQYAIKYGNLVSLSEQELTDCDRIDGHCLGGGETYDAFQAIIDIGGLESDTDYPYVDKKQNCTYDKSKSVTQLSAYKNLTQDETQLAAWLAQNGPISVGVNANPFQSYTSGIINNPKCKGGYRLDHAVTLVGYGTENNLDYWIIKNSWGADWGEQGYVRLARGVDMCGVAEQATTSILV